MAAAGAAAAYRPSPLIKTNSSTLFHHPTNFPRKTFSIRCCSPERNLGSHNPPKLDLDHPSINPTPQPPSPAFQSPPFSSTPPPSSRGQVFDVGPANSWDGNDVGSPVVKRFVGDDEERWLMWYHGGADGNSIGLAVSNNGIHWERGPGRADAGDDVGQVMRRSVDWWAFDTESVRPSDVLIMSSAKLRGPGAVYWLYYTGFSQEKVENSSMACGEVFKSLPGLAISQDGRHWARIEGEHHSGALFDAGMAGEWDALFVAAPKVVFHGPSDLRMYYHSFDPECGQFAIGIARSRDGIRWVKLGKVLGGGADGDFDDAGTRYGHVVRDERHGRYLMAYEGVCKNGRTSIGLAASGDGLKEWRRCGDRAVLEPSMEEDGWDGRGVGDPCLVQMDREGEWRLYYRGIGRNGRTGIGVAVSEGPELASFKKWMGFHI
ncbi:uncharacterized protein LOC103705221 [Phoenix dactylifera]|uniref:Uncharacterized protein LOC103705221 n=1 Tax=Phoenix dactylifera TaxID=42345 RepID=A0A8B7BX11_PHODC|nr:uncharacterized protein LOC103705221 [Phoenix dactylifera]